MTQFSRYLLSMMIIVSLGACSRDEEVQLQEGDIDPTTKMGQKTRPRLMIVRNSQGQEVNISLDCTAAHAQAQQMTQAQASDPAYVDALIEKCRAEKESNRGAYGYGDWNWGLYFGYYYYPGYNSYSSYNYCGWFYGSYGSSWNTNCGNYYYYGNNYGYPHYNYNCYNYYNTGYSYYNSNSSYWWGNVPNYCYRNYNTTASNGGSSSSGYGYQY